jgi:hypothetical protein
MPARISFQTLRQEMQWQDTPRICKIRSSPVLRKPRKRYEKRRKIHKQVDLPIAFAIVEVFFTA